MAEVSTDALVVLPSAGTVAPDAGVVVKVDVEGAELLALRGMQTILKQHDATIVVESSTYLGRFGHEFENLRDFLAGHGYRPTLAIEDRGADYGIRPFDMDAVGHGQIVFERRDA